MPKKRFTPLKTFILGVLNTYAHDMSGYDLIKVANEWRFDHYIKATNASFYYALEQLEKDDFVKIVGTKQKENRPEQTIYKLLPKGRNEFIEQIFHFLKTNQDYYYDIDAVTPFISLFGLLKNKDDILKYIKKQIESRKQKNDYLDEGEKFIRSHYLFDVNPFMILPLDHFRLHNEIEIKWLGMFYDMVDGVDFEKNAKEIMKRREEREE